MNNENKFILKTEKIVSACVLLSSFMPENQTLREEVEMNAVTLLSDISRIILLPYYERERDVRICIRKVDHILSCIKVAHANGFISTPDKVLISEKLFSYVKELLELQEHFSGAENHAILHPSFFDDEVPDDSRPIVLIQEKDAGQKAALSPVMDQYKTPIGQGSKNKSTKETNVTPKKSESKGQRKEIIIGLFKEKKGQKLTIKDISNAISGCSEKTIQRELLTLVAENVLKKEGERRWSTYELRS